ncbi:alcohol dehydrogenase [Dipodascopsis tothii]|uniref:alcohol dehydrogenase n=1 Tax=Dipodascopsis tothii TaxID=44089 RepID=UPI0034CE311B
MLIKIPASTRTRALGLLSTIQNHAGACPCHACAGGDARSLLQARRLAAGAPVQKEYAFEMAASNIRYGNGVTREVGMDFANLGVKRVALFTDKNVLRLTPMALAVEALEAHGIQYDIYSDVRVEPKDGAIRDAIAWTRARAPEAYLAVGGGSVMDTAKIAMLFEAYPDADLLDFVNAPIGKGRPVDRPMKPLIAVPTTAGTGSETTGTAIFDLVAQRAKTGIAHRALKPLLGIVDPLNTRSMPSQVKSSSGLDVLCHSLESYTAIPYFERVPRPANPILRPAYQGANPISDVFSFEALRLTVKYLPRTVKDPDDTEAQENMLLAATLAGVGFGNAGVHLCHGISYPVSGMNKGYKHAGYAVDYPIIPHGVSVAVTAPAVFRFTGPTNPDRHLAAAAVFGADVSNTKAESAGEILGDAIARFLVDLGDQPRGLRDLGFDGADVPDLVAGTMPQARVLMLAPNFQQKADDEKRADLAGIIERSLQY